jgi:hypothetical protein
MSPHLTKFLEVWRAKVREGTASDLSNLEIITLTMYDKWLKYQPRSCQCELYQSCQICDPKL